MLSQDPQKKPKSLLKRIELEAPFFALKMRIISRFGLLPTDPRVQNMTDLQWVLLAKYVDDQDARQMKLYSALASYMLGTSAKDGAIVPLSFFLHPEAAKEVFEIPSFTIEEDISDESKILSDEVSEQLEEALAFDIDGIMSEEDREALEKADFDQLLKDEELAGIMLSFDRSKQE